MTAEALVELRDIRKEFGDLTAVDGMNLTIRQGEFFSLLGPSGCGKTTCLRMIGGFEAPTDGDVFFEEAPVTDVLPNERDTNMVFQHLSLFPHMSVEQNIEYGLKQDNVSEDERKQRVSSYLELVDLADFEDRDPTELSGGQQQRVALARALVNEPSMLLLDEPLSGLDRKLRQHMQVELAKIQRKVDGAFFYVTHDQEVAMTLSDRLAIMRDGEIEQVGTPEEIYHDPVSPFVADFIGDTNLIDGTVVSGSDRSDIRLTDDAGPTIPTSEPLDDGSVTVSVRPESVRLTRSGDALFEAEVIDRFFQGDHTEYVLSPRVDSVADLDVTVYDTEDVFESGETVGVTFDDRGLSIFQ